MHGFRKYFKTRTEQGGMKPINIEILMGHSVGISDSYYRLTENELLQDYLKAVDVLTISEEKQLRHQVEELRPMHKRPFLLVLSQAKHAFSQPQTCRLKTFPMRYFRHTNSYRKRKTSRAYK